MDSKPLAPKKKSKKKARFTLIEDYNSPVISGDITYIIAFVLPLVIMISLYYTRKIFPFGNQCYLRSDMYHQYAPFFSELWYKLRHGQSLTYSWDIGLGTNFTSLYAYYLASPSNWLIVLFPQKYMIEVMNAFIILKISLSSLSITYYITKHFKTKSCYAALFGVFYGMSGFVSAYSWNIMWLDCLVLVPLIIYGLERLVNENRCIFYSAMLGLCVFTNYYIAIMVCISVTFYFIVLMVSYDGPKSVKIYLKKFINFAIYSLIAGGIGACLLLPELYTFSLSASNNSEFPQVLSSYFSILLMVARHLIEIPVELGLDHYPNVYCGVAIFLLFPLYIMNSNVNLREKISKCLLILVFLTAFNLNIPNYIWHGLHFPNSLPARQSFIYIFFLLTMCFEGLQNIKNLTNKQIGISFWISIGLLLILDQLFTRNGTYDFITVYLSGLFIIIYGIFMFIHKNSKTTLPIIVLLAYSCVIVECTLNMDSTGIGTTDRTDYLLDYNAVDTVLETVAAEDDSFYRSDKLFGVRSKNDGAWHNYKSISTFSSTCSGGLTNLYNLLGLENSFNAYGSNGLTAFTRAFFAEKYTISNRLLTEDDLRYFYTGYDGEFIYKNEYTLPVGFAINKDSVYFTGLSGANNGIENQNALIANMTGVEDVFEYNSEWPSDSECTIVPQFDGHLYLIIRNLNIDLVSVAINGVNYDYESIKDNNRIIDVGYVETTDYIYVSSVDGSMNLIAYMMDTDKFIEAYNILNSESLNLESHSDTKLKGTVTTYADGAMLFSIPYDAGWSVYVDGKKVKTYSWENALLCIENLPAGTHTITLKYRPVRLALGIFITVFCILLLIAIFVINRLIANGTIKVEQLKRIVRLYLGDKTAKKSKHKVKKAEPEMINDKLPIIDEDEILDSMDDFDSIQLDLESSEDVKSTDETTNLTEE